MAVEIITKRSVDALLSGRGDVFFWDEISGFGLKLTPSGARTYVYQYRMGSPGLPIRPWIIGRRGDLTPDQARGLVKGLSFKVHNGIDPIEQGRERKLKATTIAFSAYVEAFTDAYLEGGRLADWAVRGRKSGANSICA